MNNVENYPKKYIELGIYDFKLRNCDNLKAIYGIDVEKIKGFKTLGINADFFKKMLIRFYNAHGIEARANIKPVSVKFVPKSSKSVSSRAYLRLDIKKGDTSDWFHLCGDGTWY